jgi:hypothetical protein
MPRRCTSPLFRAIAVAAVLGAACRDSSTTTGQTLESAAPLSFERNAAEFNFSSPNSFIPLDTSSACTVGGGLEQLLLPPGFVATVVASEPAFADNADMHTVNETGWDAGRFLYRTQKPPPVRPSR